MSKTRVGIINVTGYAGVELARLLYQHPEVELTSVTGRSAAGQRLGDVFPHLLNIELTIETKLGEVDFAFSAMPHKESASEVIPLLNRGIKVIDISADFRLKDAAEYPQWYGFTHPAPRLLEISQQEPPAEPRFAFVKTHYWDQAENSTQEAFEELHNFLEGNCDSVALPEEFHSDAGAIYLDMNNYKSALKHFKKALKEDDVSFFRANIGWCYLNLDQYEEAILHYEKAIEKKKHPATLIGLCFSYFNNGTPDKAKSLLRELKCFSKEELADYANDIKELEKFLDKLFKERL